jgi:hypothetical protein
MRHNGETFAVVTELRGARTEVGSVLESCTPV